MPFDSLVRAYRAGPARFVAALALFAFALRVALTPFGAPLNLDAFAYLIKAREAAHGLWTPVRTHAIGWSLVLAPFVRIPGASSIDGGMTMARVLASAISALTLFPLHVIARRTLDDTRVVVGLLLATVALQAMNVAVRGMSEPLHTGLLLAAFAAALDASLRPVAAVACGVASGLACWVHPTGVLVPVVAVATIAASTGRRTRAAGIVTAVALLVAAPAAWQRTQAFGSPFAYGENNRIFGNSPDEMWSAHIAVPTLRDFVATHSAGSMAKWLVVDGVVQEVTDFTIKSVTLPLVPLFVWGAWLAARDHRARRLLPGVAVFLVGWIVPYPVLGASRHLAPILPVALLLVAIGATALAERRGPARFAAALLIGGVMLGQPVAAAMQRYRLVHDESIAGREWGGWIAANVRGRVAMREGQELVMLHLADAAIGGADINTMYAPASGLSLIKPGLFGSVDEALSWMRAQGATHIVVDYLSDQPAYLDGLRAHPSADLQELYSTVGRSAWPVRVYAIR